MKFNFKYTVFTIALGLQMASCGESFQGKFVGEAVSQTNTCTGSEGVHYDAIVNVQVNGGDIELSMSDIFVHGTSTHDELYRHFTATPASGSLGTTNFAIVDVRQGTSQPSQNGQPSTPREFRSEVSGRLSPARDELAISAWTVSFIPDGRTEPCAITINAPHLTRE